MLIWPEASSARNNIAAVCAGFDPALEFFVETLDGIRGVRALGLGPWLKPAPTCCHENQDGCECKCCRCAACSASESDVVPLSGDFNWDFKCAKIVLPI